MTEVDSEEERKNKQFVGVIQLRPCESGFHYIPAATSSQDPIRTDYQYDDWAGFYNIKDSQKSQFEAHKHQFWCMPQVNPDFIEEMESKFVDTSFTGY
jgi:hypothetical protein